MHDGTKKNVGKTRSCRRYMGDEEPKSRQIESGERGMKKGELKGVRARFACDTNSSAS